MNWLLSKEKDFIGKRSLRRPDCLREDRKQLVGLLSSDDRTVLPEGTQLVDEGGALGKADKIARTGRLQAGGKLNGAGKPAPVPMCGHVTSSYRSACLGHPIALALVAGGRIRKGKTIFAALQGRRPLPVQIVSPAFYDPRGRRQHV